MSLTTIIEDYSDLDIDQENEQDGEVIKNEKPAQILRESAKTENRRTTLNRRKVLVVEDDGDMAQLTRHLIEQFSGARCDIVVDSYEAIEALCDNNYDYLVVDQNLPGLKGVEVLMKLDAYLDTDPLLSEQCRFTHKIPVLLMSADAITLPAGLRLSHFVITDQINKRDLNLGLAKNFAS